MDEGHCTDADVFSEFLLETVSVTMKPQITNVGVDTCYSCKSKDMIQADLVNMTLSDVLIQAFVSNGSKSENSKCRCDDTSHPGCNISLPFLLMIYSVCFLPTQ